MIENVCETGRHSTFYFSAGPEDGTPLIFVHGWPELAISWRHQIETFSSLGFRVIAPDVRGFGRSSVPARTEDCNVEEAVTDLLELLEHLGLEKAIWVGHDFGAAVVWGLASHHPEACIAVANMCVPYLPGGFTLDTVSALVDREIYPEEQFPNGQWSYWRQNVDHLEDSARAMDSDVEAFVRICFRRGIANEDPHEKPAAAMKASEGWWPLIEYGKQIDFDQAIFTEDDFAKYVAALSLTGFAPGLSYYRNNERHTDYARRSVNGGRLEMPVLFMHARWDPSCKTMTSALPEPMRANCDDLVEMVVDTGHWLQQEDPVAVNAALSHWLATHVSHAYPGARLICAASD